MVEFFFYKIYIEFSMGYKVILSMKQLNVMGDSLLVPRFVWSFFYCTVGWTFGLPAESRNSL